MKLAIFCLLALVMIIGALYYFWVIKNEGDDDE